MHESMNRGVCRHSFVGFFIPLAFAAIVAAASLTARAHSAFTLEPPTIGSLSITPDPVTMQQSLTLTAGNVNDTDGNATITGVTFYRDNGDGYWTDGKEIVLGAGANDGSNANWTLTVAVTWEPGPRSYYAVAIDNTMTRSKPVKVTGLVVAPGNRHWQAAASGFWDDPANWQEHVIPGIDDIARFTVSGAFSVTMPRKIDIATKGLFIDGSAPTFVLSGNYLVDDPDGVESLIVGSTDFADSSLTLSAFEVGLDTENITIGVAPDASGAITVSGFDSHMTSAGVMIIGDEGIGSVTVDAFCMLGSAVTMLGREAGSEGYLLVSGHNAAWFADDKLIIGARGHGSVTVNNEAFVALDRIRIGLEDTGTGVLAIPVAALVSAEDLSIGGSETARGGTGFAHIGLFGFLDLERGLTVWDGSTLWIEDGLVTTGFGENIFITIDGELLIEDGGQLLHPNTVARLGAAADAMNALAVVSGTGSVWRMSSGAAGLLGQAEILIENSGAAETTVGGFTLGLESGSLGRLTLTDPGSAWSSVGPLVIGANGVGDLTIQDGAVMQTMGGWIGAGAGATGSRAHLIGSGSRWNLAGQLFIGGNDTQPGGAAELIIESGATVAAPSAQTYLWPTGTLTLAGGVLDGFSTLNDGGTVQGSGTLMTQFVDAGLTLPGGANAVGHLHIANGWNKQEGGSAHFEVAGDKPAQYDRVTVEGGMTLSGTLTLSFIGGYTPKPGDEYIIVSGSPVSGEFTDVAMPSLPPGRELSVNYESNRVVVRITSIFQQHGGGEKRDPHQVNQGGGNGGN